MQPQSKQNNQQNTKQNTQQPQIVLPYDTQELAIPNNPQIFLDAIKANTLDKAIELSQTGIVAIDEGLLNYIAQEYIPHEAKYPTKKEIEIITRTHMFDPQTGELKDQTLREFYKQALANIDPEALKTLMPITFQSIIQQMKGYGNKKLKALDPTELERAVYLTSKTIYAFKGYYPEANDDADYLYDANLEELLRERKIRDASALYLFWNNFKGSMLQMTSSAIKGTELQFDYETGLDEWLDEIYRESVDTDLLAHGYVERDGYWDLQTIAALAGEATGSAIIPIVGAMAGGLAGGKVGGPLGALAGALVGSAAPTYFAEKWNAYKEISDRLLEDKQKGLINISDEEIYRIADRYSTLTGLGAAGVEALSTALFAPGRLFLGTAVQAGKATIRKTASKIILDNIRKRATGQVAKTLAKTPLEIGVKATKIVTEGAITEGVEEVIQEALPLIAYHRVNLMLRNPKATDISWTDAITEMINSPEDRQQLYYAFMAGAIGGAFLSSMGGIMNGTKSLASQRIKQTQQQIQSVKDIFKQTQQATPQQQIQPPQQSAQQQVSHKQTQQEIQQQTQQVQQQQQRREQQIQPKGERKTQEIIELITKYPKIGNALQNIFKVVRRGGEVELVPTTLFSKFEKELEDADNKEILKRNNVEAVVDLIYSALPVTAFSHNPRAYIRFSDVISNTLNTLKDLNVIDNDIANKAIDITKHIDVQVLNYLDKIDDKLLPLMPYFIRLTKINNNFSKFKSDNKALAEQMPNYGLMLPLSQKKKQDIFAKLPQEAKQFLEDVSLIIRDQIWNEQKAISKQAKQKLRNRLEELFASAGEQTLDAKRYALRLLDKYIIPDDVITYISQTDDTKIEQYLNGITPQQQQAQTQQPKQTQQQQKQEKEQETEQPEQPEQGEIQQPQQQPQQTKKIRLKKIISGGQTGADFGALLAAKELRLETGGIAPKGYRNELLDIGRQKEGMEHVGFLKQFGLEEDRTRDYRSRTKRNIDNADVVIIFYDPNNLTPGTKQTIRLAQDGLFGEPLQNPPEKPYRPYLLVDINQDIETNAQKIKEFIVEHDPEVINVAGPRESKVPGITQKTKEILVKAIKELIKPQNTQQKQQTQQATPQQQPAQPQQQQKKQREAEQKQSHPAAPQERKDEKKQTSQPTQNVRQKKEERLIIKHTEEVKADDLREVKSPILDEVDKLDETFAPNKERLIKALIESKLPSGRIRLKQAINKFLEGKSDEELKQIINTLNGKTPFVFKGDINENPKEALREALLDGGVYIVYSSKYKPPFDETTDIGKVFKELADKYRNENATVVNVKSSEDAEKEKISISIAQTVIIAALESATLKSKASKTISTKRLLDIFNKVLEGSNLSDRQKNIAKRVFTAKVLRISKTDEDSQTEIDEIELSDLETAMQESLEVFSRYIRDKDTSVYRTIIAFAIPPEYIVVNKDGTVEIATHHKENVITALNKVARESTKENFIDNLREYAYSLDIPSDARHSLQIILQALEGLPNKYRDRAISLFYNKASTSILLPVRTTNAHIEPSRRDTEGLVNIPAQIKSPSGAILNAVFASMLPRAIHLLKGKTFNSETTLVTEINKAIKGAWQSSELYTAARGLLTALQNLKKAIDNKEYLNNEYIQQQIDYELEKALHEFSVAFGVPMPPAGMVNPVTGNKELYDSIIDMLAMLAIAFEIPASRNYILGKGRQINLKNIDIEQIVTNTLNKKAGYITNVGFKTNLKFTGEEKILLYNDKIGDPLVFNIYKDDKKKQVREIRSVSYYYKKIIGELIKEGYYNKTTFNVGSEKGNALSFVNNVIRIFSNAKYFIQSIAKFNSAQDYINKLTELYKNTLIYRLIEQEGGDMVSLFTSVYIGEKATQFATAPYKNKLIAQLKMHINGIIESAGKYFYFISPPHGDSREVYAVKMPTYQDAKVFDKYSDLDFIAESVGLDNKDIKGRLAKYRDELVKEYESLLKEADIEYIEVKAPDDVTQSQISFLKNKYDIQYDKKANVFKIGKQSFKKIATDIVMASFVYDVLTSGDLVFTDMLSHGKKQKITKGAKTPTIRRLAPGKKLLIIPFKDPKIKLRIGNEVAETELLDGFCFYNDAMYDLINDTASIDDTSPFIKPMLYGLAPYKKKDGRYALAPLYGKMGGIKIEGGRSYVESRLQAILDELKRRGHIDDNTAVVFIASSAMKGHLTKGGGPIQVFDIFDIEAIETEEVNGQQVAKRAKLKVKKAVKDIATDIAEYIKEEEPYVDSSTFGIVINTNKPVDEQSSSLFPLMAYTTIKSVAQDPERVKELWNAYKELIEATLNNWDNSDIGFLRTMKEAIVGAIQGADAAWKTNVSESLSKMFKLLQDKIDKAIKSKAEEDIDEAKAMTEAVMHNIEYASIIIPTLAKMFHKRAARAELPGAHLYEVPDMGSPSTGELLIDGKAIVSPMVAKRGEKIMTIRVPTQAPNIAFSKVIGHTGEYYSNKARRRLHANIIIRGVRDRVRADADYDGDALFVFPEDGGMRKIIMDYIVSKGIKAIAPFIYEDLRGMKEITGQTFFKIIASKTHEGDYVSLVNDMIDYIMNNIDNVKTEKDINELITQYLKLKGLKIQKEIKNVNTPEWGWSMQSLKIAKALSKLVKTAEQVYNSVDEAIRDYKLDPSGMSNLADVVELAMLAKKYKITLPNDLQEVVRFTPETVKKIIDDEGYYKEIYDRLLSALSKSGKADLDKELSLENRSARLKISARTRSANDAISTLVVLRKLISVVDKMSYTGYTTQETEEEEIIVRRRKTINIQELLQKEGVVKSLDIFVQAALDDNNNNFAISRMLINSASLNYIAGAILHGNEISEVISEIINMYDFVEKYAVKNGYDYFSMPAHLYAQAVEAFYGDMSLEYRLEKMDYLAAGQEAISYVAPILGIYRSIPSSIEEMIRVRIALDEHKAYPGVEKTEFAIQSEYADFAGYIYSKIYEPLSTVFLPFREYSIFKGYETEIRPALELYSAYLVDKAMYGEAPSERLWMKMNIDLYNAKLNGRMPFHIARLLSAYSINGEHFIGPSQVKNIIGWLEKKRIKSPFKKNGVDLTFTNVSPHEWLAIKKLINASPDLSSIYLKPIAYVMTAKNGVFAASPVMSLLPEQELMQITESIAGISKEDKLQALRESLATNILRKSRPEGVVHGMVKYDLEKERFILFDIAGSKYMLINPLHPYNTRENIILLAGLNEFNIRVRKHNAYEYRKLTVEKPTQQELSKVLTNLPPDLADALSAIPPQTPNNYVILKIKYDKVVEDRQSKQKLITTRYHELAYMPGLAEPADNSLVKITPYFDGIPKQEVIVSGVDFSSMLITHLQSLNVNREVADKIKDLINSLQTVDVAVRINEIGGKAQAKIYIPPGINISVTEVNLNGLDIDKVINDLSARTINVLSRIAVSNPNLLESIKSAISLSQKLQASNTIDDNLILNTKFDKIGIVNDKDVFGFYIPTSKRASIAEALANALSSGRKTTIKLLKRASETQDIETINNTLKEAVAKKDMEQIKKILKDVLGAQGDIDKITESIINLAKKGVVPRLVKLSEESIEVVSINEAEIKSQIEDADYMIERESMVRIIENEELYKAIVKDLMAKYPFVEIRIYDEKLGKRLGYMQKRELSYLVAWSLVDGRITTAPHEFAHVYIDMFREDPLVKRLIDKYGEERLAEMLAVSYVRRLQDERKINELKGVLKVIYKFWTRLKWLIKSSIGYERLAKLFYEADLRRLTPTGEARQILEKQGIKQPQLQTQPAQQEIKQQAQHQPDNLFEQHFDEINPGIVADTEGVEQHYTEIKSADDIITAADEILDYLSFGFFISNEVDSGIMSLDIPARKQAMLQIFRQLDDIIGDDKEHQISKAILGLKGFGNFLDNSLSGLTNLQGAAYDDANPMSVFNLLFGDNPDGRLSDETIQQILNGTLEIEYDGKSPVASLKLQNGNEIVLRDLALSDVIVAVRALALINRVLSSKNTFQAADGRAITSTYNDYLDNEMVTQISTAASDPLVVKMFKTFKLSSFLQPHAFFNLIAGGTDNALYKGLYLAFEHGDMMASKLTMRVQKLITPTLKNKKLADGSQHIRSSEYVTVSRKDVPKMKVKFTNVKKVWNKGQEEIEEFEDVHELTPAEIITVYLYLKDNKAREDIKEHGIIYGSDRDDIKKRSIWFGDESAFKSFEKAINSIVNAHFKEEAQAFEQAFRILKNETNSIVKKAFGYENKADGLFVPRVSGIGTPLSVQIKGVANIFDNPYIDMHKRKNEAVTITDAYTVLTLSQRLASTVYGYTFPVMNYKKIAKTVTSYGDRYGSEMYRFLVQKIKSFVNRYYAPQLNEAKWQRLLDRQMKIEVAFIFFMNIFSAIKQAAGLVTLGAATGDLKSIGRAITLVGRIIKGAPVEQARAIKSKPESIMRELNDPRIREIIEYDTTGLIAARLISTPLLSYYTVEDLFGTKTSVSIEAGKLLTKMFGKKVAQKIIDATSMESTMSMIAYADREMIIETWNRYAEKAQKMGLKKGTREWAKYVSENTYNAVRSTQPMYTTTFRPEIYYSWIRLFTMFTTPSWPIFSNFVLGLRDYLKYRNTKRLSYYGLAIILTSLFLAAIDFLKELLTGEKRKTKEKEQERIAKTAAASFINNSLGLVAYPASYYLPATVNKILDLPTYGIRLPIGFNFMQAIANSTYRTIDFAKGESTPMQLTRDYLKAFSLTVTPIVPNQALSLMRKYEQANKRKRTKVVGSVSYRIR